MSDSSLSSYVRQCRQAGISEREIRRAVLDAGWKGEEADAALAETSRIPPLIKAIAVGGYVISGFLLLASLFSVLGSFFFSTLGEALSSMPFVVALSQAGTSAFLFSGILLFLFALLLGAASAGLWKGRNWARMFFVGLAALHLISFIVVVMEGTFDGVGQLVITAGAAAYLLFNEEAKTAFQDGGMDQAKILAAALGGLALLFAFQQIGGYFVGRPFG